MKLNYIEWYLVELSRLIGDSVPLEKQNSLLHESKNHLKSLTEEFQSEGMDDKSSQLAAISRFGSPGMNAKQFIDSIVEYKSGKFLPYLNAGLFISICTIVACVEATSGNHGALGLTTPILPIAAAFGIYSFLRGRFPRRRWFLLPTIMSFVIGIPGAYLLTSYQTELGQNSRIVPYQSLRTQVLSLRSEQQRHEKFLKPYIDFNRSTLMGSHSTVGIRPGEAFGLQSYTTSEGSKGIYLSSVDPYKKVTTLGVDKYRVGLDGNEFSFGEMKDVQGKFLWGPMTAHDFRSYFVGQLASIEQHKEIREIALQKLEEGLNRSVFDRIILFAGYVGLGAFIFGIPAGWASCYAMVWIRKRLRYRSRRIGLA